MDVVMLVFFCLLTMIELSTSHPNFVLSLFSRIIYLVIGFMTITTKFYNLGKITTRKTKIYNICLYELITELIFRIVLKKNSMG